MERIGRRKQGRRGDEWTKPATVTSRCPPPSPPSPAHLTHHAPRSGPPSTALRIEIEMLNRFVVVETGSGLVVWSVCLFGAWPFSRHRTPWPPCRPTIVHGDQPLRPGTTNASTRCSNLPAWADPSLISRQHVYIYLHLNYLPVQALLPLDKRRQVEC